MITDARLREIRAEFYRLRGLADQVETGCRDLCHEVFENLADIEPDGKYLKEILATAEASAMTTAVQVLIAATAVTRVIHEPDTT